MIQFTEDYRKFGNVEISKDQEDSINFILSRKSSLLCLQTGMGKTLVSLVVSKILLDNFSNSLIYIVCPVKAKKAFLKELKIVFGKELKDILSVYATDTMVEVSNPKIILSTFTKIEFSTEKVKELYSEGRKVVLFIDEAHILSDVNSKFSKTMSSIKNLMTMVVLISATPLINSLDGLYNIVNFACPGFLGTKTQFNNTYTKWHLDTIYLKGGKKQKVRVIDKYINLDNLNTRLKDILIVRGKRYDIKFSKQFRDMTDSEHAVYEKVSSGMLSNTSDERNFSKRMHDLQRFIDRAYNEDEEMVELAKAYGSSTLSTKEEILIDTLKLALSKHYSLIIYASYKDTIERLHHVLKAKSASLGLGRIYEITGSIDMKKREAIEDRINENDVVLVTSAGTESINLQRCNCVIFYDTPFSCKEIIQCIGRITRIDTKHPTQYIIFCGVNDTIDEYKYSLFQQHLGVVQRAINVGTNIPLEDLDIDNKIVKELREKLLWKYKGDPLTKKLRKEKRSMKEKIQVCTLNDAYQTIAVNKFLIEPISYDTSSDVKSVKVLFPEEEKYNKFIEGKIPFTVLRSSYIDFLHSFNGQRLIAKLREGINSSGNMLFVGNTDLPKVLKEEVLKSYGV